MSRSKEIGTRGETGVVDLLKVNGWPQAERRALKGIGDEGDITGTPGICWEVKAGKEAHRAGDKQIAVWLHETEFERRNANADLGVLVVARASYGPKRAGCWWAIVPFWAMANLINEDGYLAPGDPITPVRMRLDDFVDVLLAAGYGTAPAEAPDGH